MTIGHTSSFFNHSINSTRGSFPASLASFFGLPSACLRLLQPPLEILCSDDALAAFLFLLSGLLALRIKLAVADAPGLVYIQYQLKEVQDLLLVKRQILRQRPQFIQCIRYHSLSVPEAYGTEVEPLGIQHTEETVHLRQPTQPDHGVGHTLATLSLKYGVDVKTLSGALGHYDAGFTLSTYTHATAEMKRSAADTIGSVISQTM